MPPLRNLDTAGDAVRQVIRAYHGSPYADEIIRGGFNPSRIGSGEGTAEGHGYYFTESRPLSGLYGRPVEVEIAVPSRSLMDMFAPPRSQGEVLDRMAEAIRLAPENKWKEDAWRELMRPDGEAHAVYESMLRAHNVGGAPPAQSVMDASRAARLGRAEAGRRTSQSLVEQGIFGGHWESGVEPGARNYVMFPGTEDQIRILRKYGLLTPVAAGAAAAGASEQPAP